MYTYILHISHSLSKYLSLCRWPSYLVSSHLTYLIFSSLFNITEASFTSNSSKWNFSTTIWTNGKAEVWGRVRDKRREEERRSEKRKSQKKEDAGARKGRKVAIHCVFPECVSNGSPFSLWGPGSWGCVRSTLRSRSQPSAWGPYGRCLW